MHPLIPLFFRVIVFTTSTIALGISASIYDLLFIVLEEIAKRWNDNHPASVCGLLKCYLHGSLGFSHSMAFGKLDTIELYDEKPPRYEAACI